MCAMELNAARHFRKYTTLNEMILGSSNGQDGTRFWDIHSIHKASNLVHRIYRFEFTDLIHFLGS